MPSRRAVLTRPTVTSKVVNLDDPRTWTTVVEERARLFEREMPIAFQNLAIAQHRDTLRYAHTRAGDYKPKLRRFEVGDLVYLKRQKANSMDVTGYYITSMLRATVP
jgi:hypothetical protein